MKINFTTVKFASPDGFGTSHQDLRIALQKEGIECTNEEQEISLTYSHPDALQYAKGKKKILYTMFESTKPPEAWRPYIKQADVVINPTQWGADTFKKQYGIDCKVVPLGYKTNQFVYQNRPEERDVFTFLQYDLGKRKGFFEVWEAFRLEFDEDEPVRMIFKTSREGIRFPPMWPGMEKIIEVYEIKDLVKLLATADCFVFPSRGEGFGHTPLEAMGTGLAVITVDAHGISSYFDPECMMSVKHEFIDAEYDAFQREEDLGVMVKADIDDLREKMRWAYNNRPKLLEMGQEASKMASQWTWERTAKQLSKIIRAL